MKSLRKTELSFRKIVCENIVKKIIFLSFLAVYVLLLGNNIPQHRSQNQSLRGKMNKNRNLQFILGLVLLCTLLLGIWAIDVRADPNAHAWVGNKFSGNGHEAWDPGDVAYVTGNVDGFAEGDAVPFRVSVDGELDGEQLKFLICLDLDVSSNGSFGFTEIEPWTTTIAVPGSPPTLANLTGEVGEVNAANGVIDSVTFLGENVATDGENCGDDYLGWLVEFTVTDAGQLTYILYAGHLAAPGDMYITAPAGTPTAVPAGKGASNVNGTFQARLQSTGSGDKTVNFQSNLIDEDPTAITLQGLEVNDVNTLPLATALGLMIALFGLTLFLRRKGISSL